MPAGDCFIAAAERILYARLQPDSAERVLVHGVVSGSEGTEVDGLRFLHAWVEYVDPATELVMVEDYSNDLQLVLPAALYYAVGQIEQAESHRYTQSQAAREIVDAANYGPWEPSLVTIMEKHGGVVPSEGAVATAGRARASSAAAALPNRGAVLRL